MLRDCCGADSDSDELGRMPPVDGRLAGRLGALRTLVRGRDTAVRARDMVEPRLAGDESPEASLPEPDIAMADLARICRHPCPVNRTVPVSRLSSERLEPLECAA